MPTFDQCCTTSECTVGQHCYMMPITPYCGGAVPLDYNVCAADLCSSDQDCASGEVCLPAGVLGNKVRACLTATCRTDADCSVSNGGSCAPVMSSCCEASVGLYCVYPGSGCRRDADCGTGHYCSVAGGYPHCVQGVNTCPG